MTCTSVLLLLICNPNLPLVLFTLSTRDWRSRSLSTSRLISSANLKLEITEPEIQTSTWLPSIISIITTFNNMLNNSGDRTHPYSTPTTVENQAVSPPSTLTAVIVSLYRDSSILIIFSSYPKCLIIIICVGAGGGGRGIGPPLSGLGDNPPHFLL